jgi:hypothetical protein
VSPETIKIRMVEFKQTETAALTTEEFTAIDSKAWQQGSVGGLNPPAFLKNILKSKLQITNGEVNSAVQEIEDEKVSKEEIESEEEYQPIE